MHTYSCLHGGERKFNPLSLKKKSCISIGTRRLGCQACIHLRLLRISNGMEILEIKVPLLSAHLPVHNPLSISDQLTMKPLPEVEQRVAELIQECFINQRALKDRVHDIHLELVSVISSSQTEGLTTMKHLMKEEVAESRKRSRLITRANQISKKYSKMKRKTREERPVSTKRARPVQRDDPLQAAAHASVGCPKGKKCYAAKSGAYIFHYTYTRCCKS